MSANGTTIANNAFNALCGSGTGCSDRIMQSMWTGAKYGITRDLDVIGAYYHYIQNTLRSRGELQYAGCCRQLALPRLL